MIDNHDDEDAIVDLELLCFHDVDLSQMQFEEDFTVHEKDRRGDVKTLHYHEGMAEKDLDLFEAKHWQLPEKETARTALLWCFRKLMKDKVYDDARDTVQEMRDILGDLNRVHWEDIVEDWKELYSETDDEESIEALEEFFIPLFEFVPIHGYSQGDQANVIVTKELADIVGAEWPKFTEGMSGRLSNMIYSAPIHARLEISFPDGSDDEIYLDELMGDRYEWDTDEIMEEVKVPLRKVTKTESQYLYILNWLTENLPEFPPYK